MKVLSNFGKYWLILAIFVLSARPLAAQDKACEPKRLFDIFCSPGEMARFNRGDTVAGNYQVKIDQVNKLIRLKYQGQDLKEISYDLGYIIYAQGDILQVTLLSNSGNYTELLLSGKEIRTKIPELTEKSFRTKITEDGLIFEFYNSQKQRYFGYYDFHKGTFCRSEPLP